MWILLVSFYAHNDLCLCQRDLIIQQNQDGDGSLGELLSPVGGRPAVGKGERLRCLILRSNIACRFLGFWDR